MIRSLYLYSSEQTQQVEGWNALNLLARLKETEFMADTINRNQITVFRLIGRSADETAQMAIRRTLLWLRSQARFDVMIARQSRLTEELLETIHSQSFRFPEELLPLFFIRFSDRSDRQSDIRDDPEYLKTLGFRFGCPHDYNELFQLLTFPPFVEAVETKLWNKIGAALDEFNRSFTETPILIF